MSASNLSKIDASPTKAFFVQMLTRDIELEDAILDLLDNCVDGIQRNLDDNANEDKPYQGFWAKITFSKDGFKIEDNCGGIPLIIAQQYAFRMGRPPRSLDDRVYTIGTYGIGMKRSIFKMGRSCAIISQTENDAFEVTISPSWLSDDSNWDLPFTEIPRRLGENGTIIEVKNLYESISEEFSNTRIYNSLFNRISQHYSYILHKGFRVKVNNSLVPAKPLSLLWDGEETIGNSNTIAPFLYQTNKDGVEVRLAVGFYRSIASKEEVDDETSGTRRTKENAGWTIVCNDRVVLYCDRTILTGWGEERVPSYHPQFIAISGIVYFRSKDAKKLPITTTKRGIDASSELYLEVKKYMREGLKYFTAYTNKWKEHVIDEKERIKQTTPVSPQKIFDVIPSTSWTKVRNRKDEKKYVPPLPEPPSENGSMKKRVIRFSRFIEEIKLLANYFENPDLSPSDIGNECFEKVLEQAENE